MAIAEVPHDPRSVAEKAFFQPPEGLTATDFGDARLKPTGFAEWIVKLHDATNGFDVANKADFNEEFDKAKRQIDYMFQTQTSPFKTDATPVIALKWINEGLDTKPIQNQLTNLGISESDAIVIQKAIRTVNKSCRSTIKTKGGSLGTIAISGIIDDDQYVSMLKQVAAATLAMARRFRAPDHNVPQGQNVDANMPVFVEAIRKGEEPSRDLLEKDFWGENTRQLSGHEEYYTGSANRVADAWSARAKMSQVYSNALNSIKPLAGNDAEKARLLDELLKQNKISVMGGLNQLFLGSLDTFPDVYQAETLKRLTSQTEKARRMLEGTALAAAAPAESLAGDDPVLQLKRQVDDAIHRQEQHIAALHTEREQLLQRMAQIDEETEAAGAKHVQLTQARLPLVAYEVGVQRAAQVDAERQQLIDSLKLPDDVLPHVKLLGLNPDQFHDPSDYAHFAGAFGALVTIYRRGAENIEEGRIAELKDAASALATCAKTFGPTHDSTVGLRTTLFASLTDAIGKPALERGKKIIDVIAAPARKPDPPSEQALAAARDALQGTQSPQKT